MLPYSLNETAKILGGKILGNGSNSFNQIVIDSRNLSNSGNSLFTAIKGERHDGHDFIDDMYSKGVRCFLISDNAINSSKYSKACFLLVPNTMRALQDFAKYHRGRFTPPIIGITGSNGKTIVKEWLTQCMEKKFKVVRNPKSYNSQIGVPLSVLLLNKQSEVGIFEAGISKPGEMIYLERILNPTHGIITNIGEAHQQNFTSIREKIIEKLKLFEGCESIFYCSDYTEIDQAILEKFNPDKKRYDWAFDNKNAKIQVKIIEQNTSQTSISVSYDAQQENFVIPFTDDASTENCIHIINYLLHNGFSALEIGNSLAQLHSVGMRLEKLQGINGCTLINDTYNSDINSLGIALNYLHQQAIKNKRLILSDIQQSGMSDKLLYSMVAKLVKNADIEKFVGVGKSITRFKNLFNFTSCEFYETTQQFLNLFNRNSVFNEAILIKGARSFQFETIISALSEVNHTTVMEINLDNLVRNLNYYRSLLTSETSIMVMVKALAYGSGAFEIANLLQHEKVDYLGVAFTDEGIQLRNSGISLPIMVMSPNSEDFERIIAFNLEPEIYSLASLKTFIRTSEKAQVVNYPVHIKIDTGMHRLGFMPDELDKVIQLLQTTDTIYVQGIFSHLASSSSPEDDEFSNLQINVFREVCEILSKALMINPKKHILNSAGIERFPSAHFDMVRLGIGLHGISSSRELNPVSSLKTHISQIKNIKKDETIGYNRKGLAPENIRIAVIPIGYADGLNRKFGNGTGYTLVNKQKARYIGDICMDMAMIDITGINCSEGDEVIIFGKEISITKLAEHINTIPYEILTSISARVKRIYTKE